MKQFKKDMFGLDHKTPNPLDEAKILTKLDHNHIIALIATVDENNKIVLVFPLMHSNLLSEIKNTAYDQNRCRDVMCMLFSGLEHMHLKKNNTP